MILAKRPSTAKNKLTLVCEKQKDAEPFDDLDATLTPVHLSPDLTTCIVKYGRGPDSSQKALSILHAAPANGLSYTEWAIACKAAGVSSTSFDRARDRLMRECIVIQINKRYMAPPPVPGCP
jgi:hypothetical protein